MSVKTQNWLLAALAIALALLILIEDAGSQGLSACGNRDKILAHLSENFGERVETRFFSHDGARSIDTILNPETGSWSIVSTRVNDNWACVLVDGPDHVKGNKPRGERT